MTRGQENKTNIKKTKTKTKPKEKENTDEQEKEKEDEERRVTAYSEVLTVTQTLALQVICLTFKHQQPFRAKK